MSKIVRNCMGYNPAEDLIEVAYEGQESKELFLKVQNRVLWFHQYLMERGLPGVIDDSETWYIPGAKLLLAKAEVSINGQVVGRACAGTYYSPEIGAQDPTICQTVATQAKGRALANAGFGTADCVEQPKAEDFPFPYKASSIRQCGYNPRPDMMLLPGENGTQTPYLGVKYRVRWFNTYVAETCLVSAGSSYIDDSEVWYDETTRLLNARAKVYMNGKVAGSSCASIPYDPNVPSMVDNGVVMRVCTQAKGRALANAGFGVVASALEDGREPAPCDSGVKITAGPDGKPAVKPLYQSAAQPAPETAKDGANAQPAEAPDEEVKRGRGRRSTKKAQAEEAEPKPAAKTTDDPVAPAAVETVPAPQPETAQTAQPQAAPSLPPMPVEEALAYVMPMGGFKGLTLGEVWGKDQKIVRFYASDKFTNARYTDLKRAAIAVVNKK